MARVCLSAGRLPGGGAAGHGPLEWVALGPCALSRDGSRSNLVSELLFNQSHESQGMASPSPRSRNDSVFHVRHDTLEQWVRTMLLVNSSSLFVEVKRPRLGLGMVHGW